MPFTLELDLPAAPATVFRLLTDAHALPRWYRAVDRAERLPDRHGEARLRIRRRLAGTVAVSTVALEDVVPDRSVTLRALDGPTPFTYAYRLEPTPAGTRLRLQGTISAAGLPGPAGRLGHWAEPLFARGMRDNLEALGALARSAEGAAARHATGGR